MKVKEDQLDAIDRLHGHVIAYSSAEDCSRIELCYLFGNGIALLAILGGVLSILFTVNPHVFAFFTDLAAVVAITFVVRGGTRNTLGGWNRVLWYSSICLCCLALLVAWVQLCLPTSDYGRKAVAIERTCADNMRSIGVALGNYASYHGNEYPENLNQLVSFSPIPFQLFVCPGSESTVANSGSSSPFSTGDHLSYWYLSPGSQAALTADTVILYELPGHHDLNGINVLFGDGHVDFFSGETTKKILRQLAIGVKQPKW